MYYYESRGKDCAFMIVGGSEGLLFRVDPAEILPCMHWLIVVMPEYWLERQILISAHAKNTQTSAMLPYPDESVKGLH